MASVVELVRDDVEPPASEFQSFTVEPLTGALGAEIGGIDLANLDDGVIAELRAALLAHLVLFFRDQDLTPEQHLALAGRFGPVIEHPFVEGLPDYPGIIEIVKTVGEEHNWGGGWHADMTFTAEPPLGALVYAHEVPPWGGDTLFANMVLAYDSLSDGMKQMLGGLRAVHRSYEAKGYGDNYEDMRGRDGVSEETCEHPVVRSHPETGRKLLFVNRIFTWRFAGMTREESLPLLEYLYGHAERDAFTCRFRWRANSIAFWDNRAVMHNVLSDYHPDRMGKSFRRRLHRVTIAGDTPV